MSDVEDESWMSEEEDIVESALTPLTLSADQPVYDDGVLTVNISWSVGQSQRPSIARLLQRMMTLNHTCMMTW